jgi:hypothetical protein
MPFRQQAAVAVSGDEQWMARQGTEDVEMKGLQR